MRKRANMIFHDEELMVTLPNASILIHVDDGEAEWTRGWKESKVDWAWQEKEKLYLCELKDPECNGAIGNPKPIGQSSHIQLIVNKLTNETFPNEFAKNANDTIANLPHARNANNITYIVLIAISNPAFDGAIALAAQDLIKRHLIKMGRDIPVAVLNIAEWNIQLAPRSLQRIP